MEATGYCVKCNRERPKGGWKSVTFKVTSEEELETARGLKRVTKGSCPTCGSGITICKSFKE